MSFSLGDWNAKGGSQEISGVIGKFGLGVQNEAGQRLIEFCQEKALLIANPLFQKHKSHQGRPRYIMSITMYFYPCYSLICIITGSHSVTFASF